MTSDHILDKEAQALLFTQARTHSAWTDKEVSEENLKQVFDLMKYAPTSANCSPARFKFVKSDAARERLKPHLAEGNVEKTMSAPVTVLVAHDLEFYEQLPKLFPHTDARSWFAGNEQLIHDTAFRNGSMQAAYFILAARALGLDCGPMSGFDAQGVKDTFFPDDHVEMTVLINLGYGDASQLHPRSPRFVFDDICDIL